MKIITIAFYVWYLLYIIIAILSFIIMFNWGIIFGALFFGIGIYVISKVAYYMLSKDDKEESKE